jgi:hypothetical protein
MKKQLKKSSRKKAFLVTPRVVIRGTLVLMGITLLILAAIAAINYFALDGPTVEQGAKAGQPLISALNQYKKDQGSYPAALDALAPKYLGAVPSAAPNYPFNYETCNNAGGFRLSFKLGKDAVNYCSTTSGVSGWTCSNAIFVACAAQ